MPKKLANLTPNDIDASQRAGLTSFTEAELQTYADAWNAPGSGKFTRAAVEFVPALWIGCAPVPVISIR